MRDDVGGLDVVLSDGFSRYLLVDILHGTDRVARDVMVESWSLPGDLGRDPKTTGTLRIVHSSVRGESWVPQGARGVLSPFKATLLITEVIGAGAFERRVQLGMFDVVAVPFAQDVVAQVGARWVETFETVDDEVLYMRGALVGGKSVVVASVLDVEVESLDGRVLGAAFRSPRTASSSAWDEWRTVGILPVAESVPDVDLLPATWPAQDGSRLDAVQHSARALGGIPAVDSSGQWVLIGDATPTVTLTLGDHGTVVDLTSGLTLDGFFNVVIGDYGLDEESGQPIRSEWVAPGDLSPEVMGREIVTFHTSDQVRTQPDADAAVAEIGRLATSREVDVRVTCVYNPLLELGDHVNVEGADVVGIAQKLDVSDEPTMNVTVRVRRPWQ